MMRPSLFRLSKTLVLAEFSQGKIVPGFLSAVTAATKIGFPVTAVIAGDGIDAAATEISKIAGVSSVLKVNDAAFRAPTAAAFAPFLTKLIRESNFTHVLATSTAFGRDVIPRLAAKLDVMPISDIMGVVDTNTFKRGTYAGNAITTVQTRDAIKLLTVRAASFDKAACDGASDVTALATDKVEGTAGTVWVKDHVETSDKVDLSAASVVVAGGRGLKNGENFKLLYDLAKPLKAAVGATRAVVDAGYVANDMQIGQTGKIVAPQLYIAVGLSGAIQHLAGMKDSKVICAINTDSEASIFSVADYGLVMDLFEAVPELTKLVSK